jgi:hypothetical protein
MNKTGVIVELNETLAEESEIEISALVPESGIREPLDIDSLVPVDMVAIVEALRYMRNENGIGKYDNIRYE